MPVRQVGNALQCHLTIDLVFSCLKNAYEVLHVSLSIEETEMSLVIKLVLK